MMNKTKKSKYEAIVFLGPSLDMSTARKLYPKAVFHQPASCLDVLRAIRLKPKKIILIDGYFETVAAVWHKEILFALDSGIQVYGAASLGAIRAAELACYGMIGVGEIYHQFQNGLLIDDDEVCVIHGAPETGFQYFSEAMVDIRKTLAHAQEKNIISKEQHDLIIQSAKNLFYQERSIKRACDDLKLQNENFNFDKLLKWLDEGNFISQKKLDAMAVLEYATEHEYTLQKVYQAYPHILERILFYSNTSAFNMSYSWLNQQERNLIELRDQYPRFYALLELNARMTYAILVLKEHQKQTIGYRNLANYFPKKLLNNIGVFLETMLPVNITKKIKFQKSFKRKASYFINELEYFKKHQQYEKLNEVFLWLENNIYNIQIEIANLEKYKSFYLMANDIDYSYSNKKLMQQADTLITQCIIMSFCINFYFENHMELADDNNQKLIKQYFETENNKSRINEALFYDYLASLDLPIQIARQLVAYHARDREIVYRFNYADILVKRPLKSFNLIGIINQATQS